MKGIVTCLPVVFALLWSPQFATAQSSSFDVNVGFGYYNDKALPRGVDVNTFLPCTAGTPAANCIRTPALNTFMLGFGANLLAWGPFGIGGEIKMRPTRQDYLVLSPQSPTQIGQVLQDRVTLWDFNGIFRPVATPKAELQLIGGIGGANIRFYEKLSSSGSILGNASQTLFAGSSNHFQLHAGVGAQLYLTDHVFVRPQFDLHWVRNFSQFGRNAVIGGTIWIGYSLGDR